MSVCLSVCLSLSVCLAVCLSVASPFQWGKYMFKAFISNILKTRALSLSTLSLSLSTLSLSHHDHNSTQG